MLKLVNSLLLVTIGASVSWLVTADHYGRILTGTPGMGLACRMNGLQTVWYGNWGERIAYCVDLKNAVSEQDVWEDTKARINANLIQGQDR